MSWLGSQEKLTLSDTDQSPVALNYNIASNMANFIGEMDQKNGSRKKNSANQTTVVYDWPFTDALYPINPSISMYGDPDDKQ